MKKIYPSLNHGLQMILIYLIPGSVLLFFLLCQEVSDLIKIFLIIFFAIILFICCVGLTCSIEINEYYFIYKITCFSKAKKN